MSVKRLRPYMDKIEKGIAINYPAFLKMVEALSLDLTLTHAMLSAEKQKGDLYIVTIEEERLKQELDRLAKTDVSDRSTLAEQNSSHQTRVSGSLLIYKHAFEHSQVIEFDRNGNFTFPYTPTTFCLVIENCDNFLNAKSTYSFLAKNAPFEDHEPVDIYFASGNAITNHLHKKHLARYETIYLALDIDRGGLKIASTLKNTYGDQKVQFLMPFEIEERLKKVVQRKDKDYLRQVEKIGLTMPSLEPVCKLITDHRKTLEQESYING